MNKMNWIAIIAVLGLAGCSTIEEWTEKEQSVPLSEVPAPVLAAAQGAVDGIVITEAEVEEEDDRLIYELDGTADGQEYEIEVTAEGKVLEVEKD